MRSRPLNSLQTHPWSRQLLAFLASAAFASCGLGCGSDGGDGVVPGPRDAGTDSQLAADQAADSPATQDQLAADAKSELAVDPKDSATEEPAIVPDAGPEASTEDSGIQPSGHQGLWVWGATAHDHEAEVVEWAYQHHFTDIFLLIKGVSGTVNYATIEPVMKARNQKGYPLRVWAWLVGFNDKKHDGWTYLVNDRVSPADPSYRSYLAKVVRDGIDPAKGNVTIVPDGVMLDDTFGWPGHSYGGSVEARVGAIMAAVDAIKAEVDAVQSSTGKKILLGMAPLPETAAVKSDATSITTASANEYGQDFGEFGKRCDWIVPETYRYGFYGGTSDWIGKVVANVQKELKLECGAKADLIKVYPAVVLYQSDDNPTAVAASELKGDIDAALAAGGGYSIFRYASKSSNPGAGGDGKDWPTASQLAVIDP